MKHKVKAFTLSELLVVLIIVGILVLIALPNLLPLVNRARAIEAKTGLKNIYQLQEMHQLEFLEYSSSLKELDFSVKGDQVYDYTIIEADENSFIAQAKATKDFDKDGNYNTWTVDEEMNIKEVVKD